MNIKLNKSIMSILVFNMKNIILIILFFIFNISCLKNDEIDLKLKSAIDAYINEYPITLKHKWIACYPSYNVYFDIYESDTIMSIVLLPGIGNFTKMQIESHNVSSFSQKKQDGYLLFDNKNPVVFFNAKIYSNKFYNNLITEIPDTITTKFFDKMSSNIHADPNFKSENLNMFLIKNNNFIPLNENSELFQKIILNYDVVNNPYWSSIN